MYIKSASLLRSSHSFLRNVSTKHPTAIELAFTRYGDPAVDTGIPLVIVHGLFGQKQNWNSVSKALHHHLKSPVYAIDVRNHGNSPHTESMTYHEAAEDLGLFLEKVRSETNHSSANLLGHSMGGKIAMRFAIDNKNSGTINKLIIEDVSPIGYSSNKGIHKFIAAMKLVDLHRTRKEINHDLEKVIPDTAVRQFILTNLQASGTPGSFMWKCNVNTLDRHVDDLLKFSLPVGSFRGETLFLYGGKSDYLQDDHKPAIKCLFPRVEYVPIEGAGHWVHAEKPNEFIAEVVKFLNRN